MIGEFPGVAPTIFDLYREGLSQKKGNVHVLRSMTRRPGQSLSRFRGRGMEYWESRSYAPLDEMRTIDWRVSARLNKWHTKVFVESHDRPIIVAVGFHPSMFFGSSRCFKSYLAAVLATRLAFLAWRGQDRVGALIFDECEQVRIVPKSGRAQMAIILGALARFAALKDERASTFEPGAFLKPLRSMVKTHATIFLISDFFELNDSVTQELFELRRRANVVALRIFDPLETSLPDVGMVGMQFGQERLMFDSHNRTLREAFRQEYEQRLGRLVAMLNELNIPHLDFCTTELPEVGLMKLLHGKWQ